MTRTYPDLLEIAPIPGPLDWQGKIPGSKSYTNRALLIAALAQGSSCLHQALFSDDTGYMAAALRQLGIAVRARETEATFLVEGTGGRIQVPQERLYLGNSGTAIRFLTALVGLGHGTFVLDGNRRMRQRPIQDLLDGLRALGVHANSRLENGCPPVTVHGCGIQGGTTRMAGNRSSQYFTAILLVAPYARRDVILTVTGDLVSKPYIDMTLSIMAQFGVQVEQEGYCRFVVPVGQRYEPRVYVVEPDASNASYFLAAAALLGGRVRVEHLGYHSAQGDVRFVDLLEQMGCQVERGQDYLQVVGPDRLRGGLQGLDVDLGNMPDVAQTLAVLAPFARTPTRIRNVATMRIKESDRIAAVVNELSKLGVAVEEHHDGMTIYPSGVQPGVVATYDDHRMAMSFALLGLKQRGIKIRDPGCVNKTFPQFFEVLAGLG